MTQPLRLALLGYGFIGRVHEQAALACDLQVTHICRSHDDWRSAVQADDVDAVVVGTPNALHHPQALAALEAGKHVLIDKPMAVTVAEGEELVAAASISGLTLLVGHMWRYRDEVIAARDRIAAGSVGRPVRTRGFGVHARWGPAGWFTDPDLAGGGALIDMGIHAIDTARFLLGDPAPVRVTASIGTAYGDYAVDDDGVVLIEWSNGVRSVVESGLVAAAARRRGGRDRGLRHRRLRADLAPVHPRDATTRRLRALQPADVRGADGRLRPLLCHGRDSGRLCRGRPHGAARGGVRLPRRSDRTGVRIAERPPTYAALPSSRATRRAPTPPRAGGSA